MYESQKEKIELKGAVQSLDRCWRVLKNAQKSYRSSNRDQWHKDMEAKHYMKMASDAMDQFKDAMENIDINKLTLDETEFIQIIKGDKQI